MTVYVDDARIPATVGRVTGVWSRLYAGPWDDPAELQPARRGDRAAPRLVPGQALAPRPAREGPPAEASASDGERPLITPESARRERTLTVLKDRVRELRPAYLPANPASRRAYDPGELAQCDFWFPRLVYKKWPAALLSELAEL